MFTPETTTGSADSGHHGRRVAGLVVGGRPEYLAGGRIERPNTCAIWAADIHEHPAVIHQRRTGGSEEAFRRIELLPRIHAPEANNIPMRDVLGHLYRLCWPNTQQPKLFSRRFFSSLNLFAMACRSAADIAGRDHGRNRRTASYAVRAFDCADQSLCPLKYVQIEAALAEKTMVA